MTNTLRVALPIAVAMLLVASLAAITGALTPARTDAAFHLRWVDAVNQPQRIYPGISATFRTNPQRIEYALQVEPGVAPDAIAIAFDDAERIEVEQGTGDLVLFAGSRRARFPRPVAFQLINGTRVPVDARFIVDARGHVRYQLGAIDPRARLFIH